MSWREQIRTPATFRGVPFHLAAAERSGGRRTVTHEYPLRDEPFLEDMGRRARAFPVEGYVVGEGYLTERDALIEALEAAGPGEFVHPYHGPLQVVCTDFRVRESTDEGGMARFSIEFTQSAPRASSPTAVVNPADLAKVSAEVTRRAAADEFLSRYRTTSYMDSAAAMLRAATLRINSVRSRLDRPVQEAAMMRRRVDELLASSAALARAPGSIVGQLGGMFGWLSSSPEALAAYGFSPGPRPPSTTSSRRAELENYLALQALIQRLAVIRAAEVAPAEPFGSQDDAIRTRAAIVDRLDEQMEEADPSTFTALVQLRADVVKAVPPPNARLPQLAEHTPPRTVPSLVLAHRLYGDVSLERDLVDRNRVSHPGFIIGGRSLEVRTRG